MSDETALVPLEQKRVLFYDDEIVAVLVQEDKQEEVYVPLRQICDYLGLAFSGQRTRINRDPVLSESVRIVTVTIMNPQGGNPNVLCMPLKFLPGWLFGISVNRVRPELQDKIIRYQREAYDVLWEAFQEGRLSTTDSTFQELLEQSESEAVEAYRMLQAMIKIARNQIMLESRLDVHGDRLDDYEERLEEIEVTLGDPKHHITPDQASRISQAVKAIAHELGKRTGRNEYGGVYGELYRRYSINSYKELPADKYEDAMNWLNSWLQSLIDDVEF
jgi:hypothetical protein